MESNVIVLDSARAECWYITVGTGEKSRISCFFDPRTPCWVGMVSVQAIGDVTQALLDDAKNAMKSARAQSRWAEVRQA